MNPWSPVAGRRIASADVGLLGCRYNARAFLLDAGRKSAQGESNVTREAVGMCHTRFILSLGFVDGSKLRVRTRCSQDAWID